MTEIYILNSDLEFMKNIEDILLKEYNIINPRINHDEYGRPIINHSSLCISISYSKKINVFVISEFQIGIDIEEIKRTYPKLICRIFTDNEKKYINEDREKEGERFYNIWCCKEAIGKFLGIGLQYSTKSICTVNNKQIKKFIKINDTYNRVYLNSYYFMNHIIVLCSENNEISMRYIV